MLGDVALAAEVHLSEGGLGGEGLVLDLASDVGSAGRAAVSSRRAHSVRDVVEEFTDVGTRGEEVEHEGVDGDEVRQIHHIVALLLLLLLLRGRGRGVGGIG